MSLNQLQASTCEPTDEFEKYLLSLETADNNNEKSQLMDAVADLSRQPRLKISVQDGKEESVLKIWYRMKSNNQDLYALAATFLGIPCTQVTVERAFSGLALILTDHRTNLIDETLQNILLIRLNSELLKRIDFNQVKV